MASDRELFLEFQKIWTYDKVKGMSFKDYTDNAGKNRYDFTYWIEVKLQNMGSIWGGSSFKFGIFKYHKKSSSEKVIYDDEYCWLKKYGNSREQAFENIKDKILQIIKYSENNELEKINDIDLGDMYKWKIAFHYQKHDDMKILDIFSSDIIKKIYEKDFGLSLKNISEFHRKILPDTQKFSLVEVLDKARYYNEKYPEFFRGSKNGKSSSNENFEEEIIKMPQGKTMKKFPLNQILYGPPGTGKTYNTIVKAMEIIDDKKYENIEEKEYEALKKRFDDLKQNGQIEFITFHQSYGYEEFVEGIKPVFDDENSQSGELKYEIKDGIFKEICERANLIQNLDKTKTLWRLYTLPDGKKENDYFDECIKNEYVYAFKGWGYDEFKNKVESGDYIAMPTDTNGKSKTIRAFGIIEDIIKEEDNKIYRKIKWLWYAKNSDNYIEFDKVNFNIATFQAVHKGKEIIIETIDEIGKVIKEPYILIIDEINRGNISKIFGELITLIEESKRIKNPEELRVALPYSGKKFDNGKGFGVPKNLYIIGTMNTADRSIALIDTALRRRFEFVEMMPKAEKLKDKDDGEKPLVIDGVNLQKLLNAINERIEFLLDREHKIGHAYFIGVANLSDLRKVFKNKIIPLLQEYFYDDYEKIRAVLNDNGMITDKPKPEFNGEFSFIDDGKMVYQICKFDELTEKNFIKIYDNSVNLKEQNEQNEPKE